MVKPQTSVRVPVLTVEEFGKIKHEQGARILEFQGVVWQERPLGFFSPLHLLQRLPSDCSVPDSFYRWGWRYCLQEDAEDSSYFMPAHMLINPSQYSESSLTSNDRRRLRKARSHVNVIPVEEFTLIERDGYDVYANACLRTRQSVPLSKTEYLAHMRRWLDPLRRLVLAAFVEDKLVGYTSVEVVDRTAYSDEIYISELGRKHDANRLLVYELTQALGRTAQIQEFFIGFHWPEKPSITNFKLSMGFPIVRIPIKAYISGLPQLVIHKFFPHKLYRLIGKQQCNIIY